MRFQKTIRQTGSENFKELENSEQKLGKFLEKKKEMDKIYLETQRILDEDKQEIILDEDKQEIILGIVNNLDIENINKRWDKLTKRFAEKSKDLDISEGRKLVEDFKDIDNDIAEFGKTIEDEKVISTGKETIQRKGYMPGSRKRRIAYISKIPITNSENKIIGLVGLFNDITKHEKERIKGRNTKLNR